MSLVTLRTAGVLFALFTVLLTFFPMTASAQSAASRDFLNVPVNTARFFLSFLGTRSETAAESALALPNTEAVSRLGSVSALWSFPLGDRYGGVALTGNYATVKVKSPLGEIETSGFSDPSITFHANIFGAPALRGDEFALATQQTFSSFHLTVSAPLGSYDRNSAVNVGANRWSFTPLLSLSITPDKGVSWIDLYAGGRFFTNNNAFRGAHHLSQEPLASFTTHYSHNIGQLTYASIGLCYDTGGETSVDGVSQHDSASGFRPSVSISRAIGKYRVTLGYENTSSKPRDEPTNWLVSIQLSGSLYPF